MKTQGNEVIKFARKYDETYIKSRHLNLRKGTKGYLLPT